MLYTKIDIVITHFINNISSNTEVADCFHCVSFSCKTLKTRALWVMWMCCFWKVNSASKQCDKTLVSIGPNNTPFIIVLGSTATRDFAQKGKKFWMQNSMQITLYEETWSLHWTINLSQKLEAEYKEFLRLQENPIKSSKLPQKSICFDFNLQVKHNMKTSNAKLLSVLSNNCSWAWTCFPWEECSCYAGLGQGPI